MTYWQAMRDSFWDFMKSWRWVPKRAQEAYSNILALLLSLLSLALLLIGPLLAPLAPIWGFIWLKAHRYEERSIAEAKRKIDEHYGHLHQRVKK